MEQENILGKEKIGKLILKFSIPCIVSMLVNSLYNIVDQIFIGQGVGTLGNGATNVVFPLVMIGLAFSLMFGDGASAYLSLKLGEKKKKEAAAANNNSNSNSSDNSSSNSSSSSTSSKGGSQSSWSITAVCWVESEGQNVTFNAPQVIYDAWNNGKGYDWCQADDNTCYWNVEGGTIGYACDRYGNVLYTFN